MTQKYLGLQLGFGEKNADSRVAQYENGRREPKSEYAKRNCRSIAGINSCT